MTSQTFPASTDYPPIEQTAQLEDAISRPMETSTLLGDPRTVFHSRLLPAKPTFFHGRDKELERLVGQALLPSPQPLGIMGPGGIGKTTLALRVAHDQRIRSHFSGQRFFLSCEGARSVDDVLGYLAFKLGVERSHDQSLWWVVLDNLRSRQRIFLVLDNFESIWSPMDETLHNASEAFLSQLAAVDELALMVTTRGNTLPKNVTWANSDHAELDTLSSTAARATFTDLSCLKPEILESEIEANALTTLLREIDFMPLAITLLARLDDPPSSLLREWFDYHTGVLEADRHDGTRRELSVEVSIKISLAHLPVETPSVRPRQLLSVLGQLPAGLFPSVSSKLYETVANISSASESLLRHSLVYTGGLGELKTLSPIRHLVSRIFTMTSETQAAVDKIYIGIAHNAPHEMRIAVEGPAYDVEIPNIINTLTAAVDRRTDDLVEGIFEFAAYCRQRQQPCLLLLHKLHAQPDTSPLSNAHCHMAISFQYEMLGELELALKHLEQATDLFSELGQKSLEATATKGLAYILTRLGRDEDANQHTSKYQRLLQESSDLSYTAMPLPGEDIAVAEKRYKTALRTCMEAGDDLAVVRFFNCITAIAAERGDVEALSTELELAVTFGEQRLPGSLWLATIKAGLARNYLDRDNLEGADKLLVEAYAIMSEHNDRRGLAAVTRSFGQVRLQQRRFTDAIELYQAASRLYLECSMPEMAETCKRDAIRTQTFCAVPE